MSKNLYNGIQELCNNKAIISEGLTECSDAVRAFSFEEIDKVLIIKNTGEKIFEKCIYEIENTDRIGESLSRENIIRKFVEYLIENELNGKLMTDESIKEFLNEIKVQPMEEYFVFHKLYGICCTEECRKEIGKFFIIGSGAITDEIVNYSKQASPELILEFNKKLSRNEGWVCCRICARESFKAKEKAYEELSVFQNILRILAWEKNHDYKINILNSIEYYGDECWMMTKEQGGGFFKQLGGLDIKLQLEDIKDVEMDFLNRMEEINEAKTKCELYSRLIRVIGFTGRAISEGATSIGFLQGMMAIECLLMKKEHKYVDKSISANICEACAFLLGNNQEERIVIDKEFRDLYGIRSGIAHGGKDNVEKDSYYRIINYAVKLIKKMCLDKECSRWKSSDDIVEYVKRMRYK